MARFIKEDKKSQPEPDSSPTETFDFAAIARDLGAENGPSSFDSLLGKPVEANAQPATPLVEPTPPALASAESGLDFADLFTAPPSEVPAQAEETVPAPAAVPFVSPAPSAEPVPVVMPVATAPPDVPDASGAPVALKAKKPPLVPIIGGVIMLALVCVAFVLTRPEAPEPLPIAPSPEAAMPPRPVAPQPQPQSVKGTMAPPASKVASQPVTKNAPQPLSSKTKTLTPQTKAKLKVFWDRGRLAKARKDYAGARSAWQQALQLQPGWPGFQDSIDKLPPQP